MIGVWVNAIVVLLGSILGDLLRRRSRAIPARFHERIMQALGLCVLLIGISGAIETKNALCVILSMVLGAILGEMLRIEERLDRFGAFVQKKLSPSEDASFGKGFVAATLLFCVGSMAVVGSLQAGLRNDPGILLAKSLLDAVSSILFASTFGIGVALSALSLLVYQGGIALLSGAIGGLLSDAVIVEMSAAGSLLILALGINMLGFTKEPLKVGNFLPAMFFPIIVLPFVEWLMSLC